MKGSFSRPLWIDSLYGSNNSNLPSIYDESYARIRRSNATTTNDYHSSTLATTKQKSNDQIDEMTKYSLTDVILQSSNLQDTCVSDSRLCEKHEQKQIKRTHSNQKSMRRVQSELNVSVNQNDLQRSDHTLQSSSMTDQRLNKKSKSLAENLHRNQSTNQQENISSEPKIEEEIVEHKPVSYGCSF